MQIPNSPFTTTGSASNSLPTLKLVTFVGPTDGSYHSAFNAEVTHCFAGYEIPLGMILLRIANRRVAGAADWIHTLLVSFAIAMLELL